MQSLAKQRAISIATVMQIKIASMPADRIFIKKRS